MKVLFRACSYTYDFYERDNAIIILGDKTTESYKGGDAQGYDDFSLVYLCDAYNITDPHGILIGYSVTMCGGDD